MDDGLFRRLRKELKPRLASRRVVFTSHGFEPMCGYCWKGIIEASPDMHEALITRGDIQGRKDLGPLIISEFNCVLVHPGGNASPCHAGIQTKEGQLRAMAHIIKWEGQEQTLEWLTMLQPSFRSPAVADALRMYKSVVEDLNGQAKEKHRGASKARRTRIQGGTGSGNGNHQASE